MNKKLIDFCFSKSSFIIIIIFYFIFNFLLVNLSISRFKVFCFFKLKKHYFSFFSNSKLFFIFIFFILHFERLIFFFWFLNFDTKYQYCVCFLFFDSLIAFKNQVRNQYNNNSNLKHQIKSQAAIMKRISLVKRSLSLD